MVIYKCITKILSSFKILSFTVGILKSYALKFPFNLVLLRNNKRIQTRPMHFLPNSHILLPKYKQGYPIILNRCVLIIPLVQRNMKHIFIVKSLQLPLVLIL